MGWLPLVWIFNFYCHLLDVGENSVMELLSFFFSGWVVSLHSRVTAMQRPWLWSHLPSGSLMRRALMRLQMKPKTSSALCSARTPGDFMNIKLLHSLQIQFHLTNSNTVCVSQAKDVLWGGTCTPLDGSFWLRKSLHHQESVQGEDEEVFSQAEVEGTTSTQYTKVLFKFDFCFLWLNFLSHRKQARPCWPWREWLCYLKATTLDLLPVLERVRPSHSFLILPRQI